MRRITAEYSRKLILAAYNLTDFDFEKEANESASSPFLPHFPLRKYPASHNAYVRIQAARDKAARKRMKSILSASLSNSSSATAISIFNISSSPSGQHTAQHQLVASTLTIPIRKLAKSNGKPLNVLFLSRGTSGTGRTLAREKIIADTLTMLGAHVIHVWPTPRDNVKTQLSHAYHANVVRSELKICCLTGCFSL